MRPHEIETYAQAAAFAQRGPAMSRGEHLQRAKDRALEHVADGNFACAVGSLVADLQEHPETADLACLDLAMMLERAADFRVSGADLCAAIEDLR